MKNKKLLMNFYKDITQKDSLRNQCIKSTNKNHSFNKEKRNLRETKNKSN